MMNRFYDYLIRSLKMAASLSLVVSIALAAPSPCKAQVIPQTTGIFAVNPISRSGTITSSILTNKYVKGIFVALNWNNIEATEGIYTWTLIDSVLNQAAASGKLVTIGVMAGYNTPSWVYTDGAKSFKFLWDKPTTTPAICSVQSIPVPGTRSFWPSGKHSSGHWAHATARTRPS